MSLVRGPQAATPAGIRENIERMVAEGRPTDEAVAVAHQIAEEEKKANEQGQG